MAKAINWPLAFRAIVLAEDCEAEHCAFRLGALYYEHRFWTPGEVVDIRVNHLKIRKGVIQQDLKCCRLKDLSPEDFQRQKPGLRSLPEVVAYLRQTYGQPVDENTEVTVVVYKNLPIDPETLEEADDPHAETPV